MPMKKPSHPGSIIRELCLEPLGLTVIEAATGLGVSRLALTDLLNEKGAVSAEMAIRLEMGFGSTARTWLELQLAYDLASARTRMRGLRIQTLAATN